MADLIRVPSVDGMNDETLMKHMEFRHDDDLRLEFQVEPDRAERRLMAADLWRSYHDAMHRLYPRKYDHTHPDTVRGS